MLQPLARRAIGRHPHVCAPACVAHTRLPHNRRGESGAAVAPAHGNRGNQVKRKLVKTLAVAFGLVACQSSHAGIYTDDLGRCLVAHTSSQDRIQLVRWIFLVAALHPAVSDISQVTPKQREDADRGTADLMLRLITDSCRKQAHDAMVYEGPQAMEASFSTLGQVAMRELMTDPHVQQGFSGFAKFLDQKKFKDVMGAGK